MPALVIGWNGVPNFNYILYESFGIFWSIILNLNIHQKILFRKLQNFFIIVIKLNADIQFMKQGEMTILY